MLEPIAACSLMTLMTAYESSYLYLLAGVRTRPLLGRLTVVYCLTTVCRLSREHIRNWVCHPRVREERAWPGEAELSERLLHIRGLWQGLGLTGRSTKDS